ncbi:Rad52/Rad22 family DNA repair protein, partial [Salmonella enterica]|uniref:Rad52/Rad22 family DNA repair protein n=1 Tax=Salmonella enterica TaxID=28901 RepID=UPI00329A2BFB
WRNEYRDIPNNGGVECGISIKVGSEWVTKWDAAENTQVGAVKGGRSGAMWRAAVQSGIGRYLHNLEEGFVQISS